jgi:hypothetical protein
MNHEAMAALAADCAPTDAHRTRDLPRILAPLDPDYRIR